MTMQYDREKTFDSMIEYIRCIGQLMVKRSFHICDGVLPR